MIVIIKLYTFRKKSFFVQNTDSVQTQHGYLEKCPQRERHVVSVR